MSRTNARAEGVKTQQDVARKVRERFEDDLNRLMADQSGRRFVWWLLTQTHVYATSFRQSGEMAFLEGERNIGLKLINEIRQVCPEQNLTMEREAIADAKRAADLAEALTTKDNEHG